MIKNKIWRFKIFFWASENLNNNNNFNEKKIT